MSKESSSTEPDADTPRSAAAKLFDIRLLIGALFTLYGVMLTVAGFFTSDAEKAKASNINMNLWLGLGMLILGLLFLLWQRLNPLKIQRPTESQPPSPVTSPTTTAPERGPEGRL